MKRSVFVLSNDPVLIGNLAQLTLTDVFIVSTETAEQLRLLIRMSSDPALVFLDISLSQEVVAKTRDWIRGLDRAINLRALVSTTAERITAFNLKLDPVMKDDLSRLGSLMFDVMLLELNERMKDRRDFLSGLPSRKAFMQQGEAQFARLYRSGGSLAIMLIDVDRFKSINDHYGHDAGDAAIAHVGEILRTSLRGRDLIERDRRDTPREEQSEPARYGGEEFVAVLFGAPYDAALRKAEALRQKIAATPVRWKDQEIPVTVSIGVANFTTEKRNDLPQLGDFSRLITEADQLLKKAKESGRNRVC